MAESLTGSTRVRVPPPQDDLMDAARVAFRELLAYQRGRARVGQTILRVPALNREAHLLTLEDGEHLMILILQSQLCYWAGSHEPLEQLHRRVCAWLTEPAPTGLP